MIKNIIGRILHTFAFVVPFGSTLRPILHRMRGVTIGKNVWISKYVYIDENHPESIFIGDNSTLGFRCTIFAHTYFGKRQKVNPDKVIIGKNVFIGPHCLILPNVTIGDNSVIKGGSVVSRNVPPNTLWGPPQAEALAKLTVPLTSEYSYEEFMKGIKPIRKQKVSNEKNN